MKLRTLMMSSAMVAALALAPNAYAEGKVPPGVDKAKWEAMSKEEKKAFRAERKAKWEAMGKEEKLEMIEQHREERMQKMEAKWETMSDDEKISYVEKKMEKRKAGKGPRPDAE